MKYDIHPTPNFDEGRQGRTPIAVVLHTTVGSARSALSWFGDERSAVSSHYLVQLDGRIAQLVDEGDTARHAGRVRRSTWPLLVRGTSPNLTTIGVEFEDGGEPDDASRSIAQYSAGARLVAEIATRWGIPIDEHHVIGHREINGGKTCPAGLDIGRIRSEAARHADTWHDVRPGQRAARFRPTRAPSAARLVWLLPVRNDGRRVARTLDTFGEWCDGVIALDDGSDDDTLELLRRHPHIDLVLRNPSRSTYAGWHDGANRNRLLQASAELEPDWVLFLDADETIQPRHAELLRQQIDTGLDPTHAYGFRHRRLWGRGYHDAQTSWVYRLFAPRPGDTLPTRRLHFTPVPTRIPSQSWTRLDIDLDHHGSATPEQIRRRLRKYEEADPRGRYGESGGLAETPGELVLAERAPTRWARR